VIQWELKIEDCLLLIMLSSLKTEYKNHACMLCACQLLSTRFLAALETQIFVNKPRN